MKLTREIIEARMVIYEEIVAHLNMEICDHADGEEDCQRRFVQEQIRVMAKKWYYKMAPKYSRKPGGKRT